MSARIRNLYVRLAEGVSYYVRRGIDILYPAVSVFEGLEKNSKAPLTFAYVGSNFHRNRDFWVQLSLAEGFKSKDMGRHFVWQLLSFLKSASCKSDFLIIDDNLLVRGRFGSLPGFKIPSRVTMGLDISLPIGKLFGSQRHGLERRIRKNKLSYVRAESSESFDDYYHRMYLPYAKMRFDSTAILSSYEELRTVFLRGGLLVVNKEDEAVAGQLYDVVNGVTNLHSIGVRDASPEYIQAGVLGACYYFSALEMKEQGHRSLLIGYSRPFLNDGTFKYKLSLNAYMYKEDRIPRLWLGLLNDAIGLRHFLAENPFVFLDEKEGFCYALFGETEAGELPQACEDASRLTCEGVDGSVFFSFGESAKSGQTDGRARGESFEIRSFKEVMLE
jgi:hypothetical protein